MGEKRNSRWRARLETVRQPIIIIFNPAQFVVVGDVEIPCVGGWVRLW